MKEERKFLESMAARNDGLLLIDDVLKAAKNKNCVLHRHFEWDDTEAASQYRREQARSLIQKCRVQIAIAPDVSVRAFVSLPSDQVSGGGYRLTAAVLSDDDLRAQLLDDIRLTIERWHRKLYLLDSDVAALIEQLGDKLKTKANTARAAA
jgi:hypothetical protein